MALFPSFLTKAIFAVLGEPVRGQIQNPSPVAMPSQLPSTTMDEETLCARGKELIIKAYAAETAQELEALAFSLSSLTTELALRKEEQLLLFRQQHLPAEMILDYERVVHSLHIQITQTLLEVQEKQRLYTAH